MHDQGTQVHCKKWFILLALWDKVAIFKVAQMVKAINLILVIMRWKK